MNANRALSASSLKLTSNGLRYYWDGRPSEFQISYGMCLSWNFFVLTDFQKF